MRTRVAAGLLLIAGWWLLSAVLNNPRLAPAPDRVFAFMITNAIGQDAFGTPGWVHLAATLGRMLGGLLLAFVIALPTSIVLARIPLAERVFAPWVTIALSLPTLVWAILAVMWFGPNDRSVGLAVGLTVAPFIVVNLWEGMKAVDTELTAVASVYHASLWQRISDLYIPHLGPFLVGAARYGFALSWKIVVIAEHFGTSNGAGFMLDYWYHSFETTQVIAWMLTFSIVILAGERLIGSWRARSTRWRLAAATG